jgi:diaminopimelate decarboxylase
MTATEKKDLAISEVLREVVRQHGTPTFAYDLNRVRSQVARLRTALPREVEILYSLKANASLGLCGVLAHAGLGADVASAGELATALAAGFPAGRIFLTGPDRSPAVCAALTANPQVVISVDSVSELAALAEEGCRHRLLLRLRPDFCSFATCSTGPDSRFGLTHDDWPECRDLLRRSPMHVVGFHVFSGSQVLPAEGVLHHLRGGLDLALRAAESLGVSPQIIDIGGGFGIPYAGESELDLLAMQPELRTLVSQAAPARIVIELGRYLVAQAGWYLTSVLALQTRHGRKAVVVDGGTHQRGDMCGLGLRQKGVPPRVLTAAGRSHGETLSPTDVLGCLSLPGDVLAEARPLPPLQVGDVLAFPNAGAYGLGASPWQFHGHPPPAEVAFEGSAIQPLRPRLPPESVLAGQLRWKGERGA